MTSGELTEEEVLVILNIQVSRVLLDLLVDTQSVGLLNSKLGSLQLLVSVNLAGHDRHHVLSLDDVVPVAVGSSLSALLRLLRRCHRLEGRDSVFGVELCDLGPGSSSLGRHLKSTEGALDLLHGICEEAGELRVGSGDSQWLLGGIGEVGVCREGQTKSRSYRELHDCGDGVLAMM
jgi:hypothetical protein